jgi:hypothetical protein
LIRTGFNGLVVNDRGESFQAAVSRLLVEPDLWRQCSVNARATVEKEFSVTTCHDKWFSLLTNLQKSAPIINYPVAMPGRLPRINPKFAWYEPDALERLLPFTTPLRNKIGRWRRQIFNQNKPLR